MKKVSICIPAYEQPENLDKCLKSISEQTFKDFEVIIMDDSKKNCLQNIVENYKNKIDIQYIKNSTSLGSPENWNKALSLAKGKYIKILHHDDNFRKSTSLETFINMIEKNNDIVAVFSSSCHVDNDGNYKSSHILDFHKIEKIKKDINDLILGNILGAPSIMMYKNGLNIKFDNRMKWLVDIDFYIRLIKGKKFEYTQEELININVGEEERVTNICINNKSINIYETMILFEKLQEDTLTFKYKWFFIILFLKFNINNIEDIRKSGYQGIVINDMMNLFKYVILLKLPYRLYHLSKKIYKKIR